MVKRRRKSKTSQFPARVLRGFLSVVILSALILGISLFVRELSHIDTQKFGNLTKKMLAKVHIQVSEEKIGDVAGKFVERISQTNLASGVSSSREVENDENGTGDDVSAETENSSDTSQILKVVILSDIHEDLINLEKAFDKVKSEDPDHILVLGDLTNYGDVKTLADIKVALDAFEVPIYTLPGDHDLAQSVGPTNFLEVFGKDRYAIHADGVLLLILNNSANFTEIPASSLSWFKQGLDDADFVFLAQPLYTTGLSSPFDKMYMGSTRDEVLDENLTEKQERVKAQRDSILELIRNSEVTAVFAGDHHKSSKLTDAEDSDLKHYTIGAISSTVSELPQTLLQSPRFSILTIFGDGTYKVDEVLLDQ